MPEIEKVLDETQEEVVALDEVTEEQPESDESDLTLLEDAELKDETDEVEEPKNTKEPVKEKPKQTPEENARYAAARREAETEAKKLADEVKTLKETLTKAQSPMTDTRRKQLEREAEEKGKDPDDYVEMVENREWRQAQRAKEALKEAEEKAKQADKQRATAVVKEFESATSVKASDLTKDEAFMDYADGKWGSKSLLEIYTGYQKLTGNKAVAEAIKSRSERSTGAASTADSSLSVDQRRRLKEWNERNPDMKMTEKDF